jgi:hypothetical protein
MEDTAADTPTKDVVLPLTWWEWDYSSALVIDLYTVEFLEDFGAFSKGEKIDCLSVDYEAGTMSVFDDEGEVLKRVHFKAVEIPTSSEEVSSGI